MRASFLFVGDLNGHYQEWLGSMTPNHGKGKKNVKSSMARSLPVENPLPQNVESITNYLQ